MIVERLLRAAAVTIALLGLVDPALTLPWPDRPIAAVVIVQPSVREDTGVAQETLSSTSADALRTRVVAALDREFDVRDDVTPDAAAVVLIGDGRSPATDLARSLPPAAAVSAVVPVPMGSDLRIARVEAPQRAHIGGRVSITVQIDAHGLVGRSSTIAIRSDGLELARRIHTWQGASERAMLTLDVLPLHTGPTRFTVAVLDALQRPAGDAVQRSSADVPPTSTADSGKRTSADSQRPADDVLPRSSADVAVEIDDRPVRVLFVNARPSWSTQFIRRALEEDPRFDVASATRVSRGVTTTTAGAPASLVSADPDAFHAIVVGAPELLSGAEVDTLRTFAHVRGGVVIFAPDRTPEGPALALMPARSFAERLLAEPVPLHSPRVESHVPGAVRLWASELAVPQGLAPGAEVLLHLDGNAAHAASAGTASPAASSARASASSPIVIQSPLGDGIVIVSGAMDAWRYRDRADAAFDHFWRDTIAVQAQAVRDPVEVTLAPAIARPGDRIDVAVRVRPTVTRRASNDASAGASAISTPDATVISARLDALPPLPHAAAPFGVTTADPLVALSTAPADARSADSRASGAEPRAVPVSVRLWPDAQPSAYHGALNVPSQAGVYAVSVQLDGHAIAGRATLWVEDDVRVVRPAWAGLQAFVDARHGRLVTADQIDRLAPQLRASIRPADTRHARHPLRSAWWIVPFAACLGGEWLLTRRRGAR